GAPRKEDRLEALQVIGGFGTAAQAEEKALLALLEDKGPDVRYSAAEALVRTHPGKAREHFKTLTAQHAQWHPQSEIETIIMFVDLQEKLWKEAAKTKPETTKDWVGTLTKQLEKNLTRWDGDLQRVDALIRLAEVGPGAKDAVPALAKL